jgi:hypothetical protein
MAPAWLPLGAAWVAGVAIAVAALALRLRHVGVIPRFTDETDVVVRALAVARGELLPLTDTDAYIGAGFSYVLAATFWLVGPDPFVPRYVPLAAGLLTIGATFLLARELAATSASGDDLSEDSGDRRGAVAAGLLAAALLAVSPVHVLVNSRIAWSHATTPLVTTAGLWLLVRALRRRDGPSLAAAGLLFGLALQSHPTVSALLPGLAAWTLWHRRRLPARRWLGAAVLLGALGCSTLLLHNALTGFESVRSGLAKADAYTAELDEQVDYPTALGREVAGLARTLAGAVGDRRGDVVPLLRPGILVWAILAPVALALTARRGSWLPVVVALQYLLVVPAFNVKYEPLLNGRYLMPIVPLVLAAVGIMVVAVWRRAAGGQVWARAATALTIALLLVDPVLAQAGYERAALAEGGNQPYVELADRIRAERRPGELVLLDADLGGARVASGREGVSVAEYLLVVHPDPTATASGDATELAARVWDRRGEVLLVLLPDTRRELASRLRLVPVGETPSGREQRLRNVGLYRVAPS